MILFHFHWFGLAVLAHQRFADDTQGRECVAYVRAEDGEMFAPNFIERLILRIAGWKPAIARLLVLVLPAALASCVSRNTPTAGVPMPTKNTVPQERGHQGNTSTGVMLGEPAPRPDPGSLQPVPGKAKAPSN